MAKLTGTRHGDAANALLDFYLAKSGELEEAGQFYMAAIALAFAVETAVLTYLLAEFGEENGGDLKIPASVNMSELSAAANEIDVLSAPIDVPSHARTDGDETPPKHLAKDQIGRFGVGQIAIRLRDGLAMPSCRPIGFNSNGSVKNIAFADIRAGSIFEHTMNVFVEFFLSGCRYTDDFHHLRNRKKFLSTGIIERNPHVRSIVSFTGTGP